MTGLGKIETSQIKNQVYEQCRSMIILGKWAPGDRLPSESQLCEQMGVSRVSVRAALQSLAAQGFIEIKRGEGSFVKSYDLSAQLNLLMPFVVLDNCDVMDVLEYRLIIEPNIMPLVVEKAKEDDIKKLEELYNDMIEHTNDIRIFSSIDEKFHLHMIEILSNNIICNMYKMLFEIFHTTWFELTKILGSKDGIKYHKDIINAIKERNAVRAKDLMHEHVERTIERMREFYNSGNQN